MTKEISEKDGEFVEETKKLLEYLDANPLPELEFARNTRIGGSYDYDGAFALPSKTNILLNGKPIDGVQKFGYNKEKEDGWLQYFISSDWLLDKFEIPGQLKVTMIVGKKEVVLYEGLTKFSNIGVEVNASDMLVLACMHWEQIKE